MAAAVIRLCVGWCLGALLVAAAGPAWGDEAQVQPPVRPSKASWYCAPPTWPCDDRCGCLRRGYDGNFYLSDLERCKRIGLSGYVQGRFDWSKRSGTPPGEDDITSRQAIERYRFILDGHAAGGWRLHARFGADDDESFEMVIGYVEWNPAPKLTLALGRQFIAVSREDWQFEEDVMTTEFSAVDSVFGTGISSGLQATYQASRTRVYACLSGGQIFRSNQFAGKIDSADWAATARVERQFGTTDWSVWNDLIGRVGRTPGVLVGMGGGYARLTQDGPPRDDFFGSIDASVNWCRGQALVYGSASRTSLDDGGFLSGYGLLAQAGQFILPTLQVYGRYERVAPGSQRGAVEVYDSVTVGCGYLPFRWTNRMRISLEAAHLFSAIDRTIVSPGAALGFLPSDDPQSYLRVQVMLGF